MIQKPTKKPISRNYAVKCDDDPKAKLFIWKIVYPTFSGCTTKAKFKILKANARLAKVKMCTSTNYEKPIACRSFSFSAI